MTDSEAESLIAIGLTNSYIKLSKEAVNKYTDSSYLSKFNLDDNGVIFATVKSYIDGKTKSLMLALQWFGSILIALFIIVLLLLFTIITVYKNTNKERISIKRFLGYSNFRIYFPIIFIVIVVLICSLIVLFMFYSKTGLLCTIIAFLLQLIFLIVSITHDQLRNLNTFLKS